MYEPWKTLFVLVKINQWILTKTGRMKYIVCFLLFLSIPHPTLLAQADGDWPVFRGKSNLSGVSETEIPSNPVLLWNLASGSRTKSSPVLGGGLLFFGNDKGILHAVDLSGKISWKSETGSAIEAPPLISADKVLAGTAEGKLMAFNRNSGKLLWTYTTDNQITGSANQFTAGQRTGIIAGSYDYFLHCVDAATGMPLWKLETLNYLNGTPAVYDNKAVFGGCDGILRIADLQTGRETDTVNIGVYIASSPAVSDNRAYFGDYDGNFYCLDIKTRKIAWYVSPQQGSGSILSIPAVGFNSVVVGNDDKYMYCYNSATGKLNWKFMTNGSITGSAVITPAKVLFGSTDGYVYILNLADGKKIWSFNAGAPISSSPVVSKDRFYILTEDGRLIAFGKKL
jgi:outer membrane protein assembly factor BamB